MPWDGYLKYYNLGEKHPGLIEKRRRVRAGVVGSRLIIFIIIAIIINNDIIMVVIVVHW